MEDVQRLTAGPRPWSSSAALAVSSGAPAHGARSFLEESDDLRRGGRDRLWPYCVRLKQSPVQAVLVERARQLSARGDPLVPPPFVDLGNFDSSRRLPKLGGRRSASSASPRTLAPAPVAMQTFQEYGHARQWNANDDEASLSSSTRALKIRSELDALHWGETDILDEALGDLSLDKIQAELKAVDAALEAVKTEVPSREGWLQIPLHYSESQDEERRIRFGSVEGHDEDGNSHCGDVSLDSNRPLARPFRRRRPPPDLPFRRTLERRDMALLRGEDAIRAANAKAGADAVAAHAENERRVARALELTRRRGNAAHARALDRLLARAAAAAAAADRDDGKAAERAGTGSAWRASPSSGGRSSASARTAAACSRSRTFPSTGGSSARTASRRARTPTAGAASSSAP